jgi:hypothetical protein
MARLLLLATLLSAAACTTGESTPPADAPAAPAPGSFGAACTTVSDQSTECTSGVCTDSFNMSASPLCSQKCTVLQGTDPTCPMGPSLQKCNMKGYCKP